MLWFSSLQLRRFWCFRWAYLLLIVPFSQVSPALALDLRIAVQRDQPQITVGSSTPADLIDGTGKQLGQIPEMTGFFARAQSKAVELADRSAWRIKIQPTNDGLVYVGNRWYRGTVTLFKTQQGIMAVNTVDLEDYLASVVGKEVYTSWPQPVLKAQAVAARSYALYRWQKQQRQSALYDLGDSTTYQVYAGLDGEADSTRKAVKATAGEVLTHNGKLIEAVFHAASGGHTENSENVWNSVTPYLRGVEDYDQAAPNYQWSLTVSGSQLQKQIPGIGSIRALLPGERTFTGRVKTIRVSGVSGTRTMTGRQFRQALGLKSTLFEVKPQAGQSFLVTGRGHGHGLGMSQWGAYGLAKKGKSYKEILSHYYQGTRLSQWKQ